MRLFKLILIAIILGSLYYFFKQQTNPIDWVVIKNRSGMELQFPAKPAVREQTRFIKGMGKVTVSSYQAAVNNDFYVLLIMQPKTRTFTKQDLTSLNYTIHALNDTTRQPVFNERIIQLGSNQAYEYKISTQQGGTVWYRTVAIENALLSLVYGSPTHRPDSRLRDRFFNSLSLQ